MSDMGERVGSSQDGGENGARRPPRLWPGLALVALQWTLRFALPVLVPGTIAIGVIGGLLGGVAVLVWWAFFSRLPRFERWGALALAAVAFAATPPLLHESVATSMQGLMFPLYVAPVLGLALVAWALVARDLPRGPRRTVLAVAILLACGGWTLVRTGGFTGDLDHDFAWRWSSTPEERLLATSVHEPVPEAVPPATDPSAEWPGFRGPGRDGVVRDARPGTDWSSAPPRELWRRPVGPGWSSFAVCGKRIFTQEQRGEDEVVSCYDLETGDPVWRHRDAARFWESNAGAGPRGTPTWADGCVYTLGATGIVNALAAADGAVLWSRDAAADTGAELPGWGFSSSPLVLRDLVVVAAAGSLVAYERATGDLRWTDASGGNGYSSPQCFTLDGVEQIVLLGEPGARAVVPADGSLLWQHAWAGDPIVQPAVLADGDLLLSVSSNSGLRRLGVSRGEDPGEWQLVPRWTSIRLKPYYNDFVVHAGHVYGLDGGVLTCVDLVRGERRWKEGRYGHGQLLLLADAGLLLVVSEQGEVALVDASPDEPHELARFQALEGKTWNHPVLVGDVLLLRNAEEMAAYRIPGSID